eukprot:CAMPEP_0180176940 /NCGR_PEP_ID=MMETSP0986-20121125/37561_1 /TAXON_ID=697907 /ORGANISM="non described non described, Strain CCMP2293" /LENGTH=98 /DNA_ID=CAMNT_0022129597 /DNA_START=387 /DNA_END=679 /DNA_ORIENTATION=+
MKMITWYTGVKLPVWMYSAWYISSQVFAAARALGSFRMPATKPGASLRGTSLTLLSCSESSDMERMVEGARGAARCAMGRARPASNLPAADMISTSPG